MKPLALGVSVNLPIKKTQEIKDFDSGMNGTLWFYHKNRKKNEISLDRNKPPGFWILIHTRQLLPMKQRTEGRLTLSHLLNEIMYKKWYIFRKKYIKKFLNLQSGDGFFIQKGMNSKEMAISIQ